MDKKIVKQIIVQGARISLLLRPDNNDFISLTDMAKKFGDDVLIYQWMRNRNTLEFLGIWERMHNYNFKGIEFETFKKQAGMNNFSLTPRKWINATNAIGIVSRAGRYGGGTYAHIDIAFEFGSWLSAEFKLYLIKEFQRLKLEESKRLSLGWNVKRILTKINYRLHTDSIKIYLLPSRISKKQANFIYSSEADLLNMALFGMTAKQWRHKNPNKKGNIRDFANVYQLVCLANLETLNAEFIRQRIPSSERLLRLNEIAIIQMNSLLANSGLENLKLSRK